MKSIPESRVLGQVDLCEKSVRSFTFICPDEINSFTFVIPDEQGEARPASGHPDWALVVRATIRSIASSEIVIDKRLEKRDMIFTNWSPPSTSVLLKLTTGWLGKKLVPGNRYNLTIEVVREEEDLGEAQVVLWLMKPSLRGTRNVRNGKQ